MAAATNTAELLWGPPSRPKRGPKPALSLDRILTTAIALADADGLDALSMQKLAEELGFTKMSLYRYTPGRTELTALMLDAALGAPPNPLPGRTDWRPQLHALAADLARLMAQHPWTMELAVGVRIFGPNELSWLESGLAALAGTALTGGEKLDAIALTFGHVRAMVQQAATPTGGSEHDLEAVMADVLAENAATYPEVVAAFAAARAGSEFDKALEFGLARIFDGLGVLIADRSRR